MMNSLPLELRDGHLFVVLGGELWLLDTGAQNGQAQAAIDALIELQQ